MAITKPICAYIAESNDEAWIVKTFLENHGVPAHYTADLTDSLAWELGTAAQIYKREVWISESDQARAAELLRDYEADRKSRKAEFAANQRDAIVVGTTDVQCDNCGKTSTFPSGLRGSVQACSHCGAYLDVGEVDWPYDDTFGEEE